MPIAAVISLLTGPFGKVIGYAAAALAVVLLGLYLIREHDNRIRAEDAAKVAQETADARVKAAEAGAAALAADAVESAHRGREINAVNMVIANAPPAVCPAPADMVAAFGLLKP